MNEAIHGASREQTEDGATARNDRLIAVSARSRNHHDVREIDHLSANLLDEIQHFFVSYNMAKDKEFRPLNEEAISRPPELDKPKDGEEQQHGEWPLRAETTSPSLSRPGTSSYSTMPRIQDNTAKSPLASPRPPQPDQMQTTEPTRETTRVPEPPEETEEKTKGGCGCCVIM